jgi:hypothetical protein
MATGNREMVLSSGKPLQWVGGRPVYSEAQMELCGALIHLPPHPLDKNKRYLMASQIEALDLLSDSALRALAEKINLLRQLRQIKYQPRLYELKASAIEAVKATQQMEADLAAVLRQGKLQGKGKQRQRVVLQRPAVRENCSAPARPRVVLRRPEGCPPAAVKAETAEAKIDCQSLKLRKAETLIGRRCAVRVEGQWLLGTVATQAEGGETEIKLDNGKVVAGVPEKDDFKVLD